MSEDEGEREAEEGDVALLARHILKGGVLGCRVQSEGVGCRVWGVRV